MDFEDELENQIEKDIEHLRKLGYAQELYRTVGGFSNFAITFSVISILSGLLTLYGYGLELVGPFTIWTWVIVGSFQLMVALSLGEVASIYPLAGGVYKWTGRLSNPHIGWLCGCFSLLGWLACTAGIQFGMGVFLSAFLGLGVSFQPVFLCTAAIICLHCIINIFGIKLVTWINDFSVSVHIIGAAVLIGMLLIFGGNNSLDQILFARRGSPELFYLNFMQALLMSAWTLTAFDASTNVSEESINPSRVVPWGMVFAVVSSWILGIFLLFSLNSSLPDLNATLHSNYPAALFVIRSAVGATIFKFIMLFILLAQFAAGLSSQTVVIRIIYAFSRDKGLPLSHVWRKVSPKYGIPVNSVILVSMISLLICYFGGSIQNISSLSTVGLYFSYSITIGIAILHGKQIDHKHGVFHLGRWRLPVQIISFLWTIFISTIMVILPISNVGNLLSLMVILIAIYYLLVIRKQLKDGDIREVERW